MLLLEGIHKIFDDSIDIKWLILRWCSCNGSWLKWNICLFMKLWKYLITLIYLLHGFFFRIQHEFNVHPTCINVIDSLSKVYLLEDYSVLLFSPIPKEEIWSKLTWLEYVLFNRFDLCRIKCSIFHRYSEDSVEYSEKQIQNFWLKVHILNTLSRIEHNHEQK